MKEIKTDKGKFIIENVGYNEYQDIIHIFEGEDIFVIHGENGNTRFSIHINDKPFYKLSEITEEEASKIVDGALFNLYYRDYLFIPTLDDTYAGEFRLNTAIQSLNSLLKSQGIEITNNTYIFKV